MANPAANKKAHLFIELEELTGSSWLETSRWNHALEEDLECDEPDPFAPNGANGANRAWSRPHLPTVSVPAVNDMRHRFNEHNVLLSLNGASLAEVIASMLDQLVDSELLEASVRARALDVFVTLRKERPPDVGATAVSGRMRITSPVRAAQRSPENRPAPEPLVLGQPMLPVPIPGSNSNEIRVTIKASSSRDRATSSTSCKEGTTNHASSSIDGRAAAIPTALSRDEWFAMLEPEANEEALDVLVAHVDFVDEPVIAFARLENTVDADVEGHAPVRYIFLLIGPESEQRRSAQLAHAFAGALMADEKFVSAVGECATADDFLAALDDHLDALHILPHVHNVLHSDASQHRANAFNFKLGATGPSKPSSTGDSSTANSAKILLDGDDSSSSEDEDEVVAHTLEERVRAHKGMQAARPRSHTPHSTPTIPRRAAGGLGLNETRPSFQKDLHELGEGGPPSSAGGADSLNGSLHGGNALGTEVAHRRRRHHHKSDDPFFVRQWTWHHGLAVMGHQYWQPARAWLWALEQKACKTGGGWLRPHLPEVSMRSMLALYEELKQPGAVLLDAKGDYLTDVIDAVCDHLVSAGVLDRKSVPKVADLLHARSGGAQAGRDARGARGRSQSPLTSGNCSRTPSSAARLDTMAEEVSEKEGATMAEAAAVAPAAPQVEHQASGASSTGGSMEAPSLSRARSHGSNGRNLFRKGRAPVPMGQEELVLLPHNTNAEGCEQFIASGLDWLEKPLLCFIRLATSQPVGCTHTEPATRARFVLIVLSPDHSPVRAEMLGSAFAGLLLDEELTAAMSLAGDVDRVLSLLARELECVTVVPHALVPLAEPGKRPEITDEQKAAIVAHVDELEFKESGWSKVRGSVARHKKANPRISRLVKKVKGARMYLSQRERKIRRALPISHKAATRGLILVHNLQRFSVPLLLGILLAVVWSNVDAASYEWFVGADPKAEHWSILGDTWLFGHKVTLHFIINDIFMCFFFGLAAKEVTEACLPGGSLNPVRKALSPLIGTVGGVATPIAVYMALSVLLFSVGMFDGYTAAPPVSADGGGHRRLAEVSYNGTGNYTAEPLGIGEVLNGWGVPTATDISLAWLVAVQVFPLRHPAIEFLLLLAVADDAIGLVIIAVQYGDPYHPAAPEWLGLVVAGVAVAIFLRKVLKCNHWSVYVVLAGIPCWMGLILAALHPALALVFIIPMLPSVWLDAPKWCSKVTHANRSRSKSTDVGDVVQDALHRHTHAALHAFEHSLKLPVDFGMFFFTLANAGVNLAFIGPLTLIVAASLVVGKILGILFLVVLASRTQLAPLNPRICTGDVGMIGATASIGLTVALFISGEAFAGERLQAEAKMGALLSGLMGVICVAAAQTPWWKGMQRRSTERAYRRARSGRFAVVAAAFDNDKNDIATVVTDTLTRALRQAKRAQEERRRLLSCSPESPDSSRLGYREPARAT